MVLIHHSLTPSNEPHLFPLHNPVVFGTQLESNEGEGLGLSELDREAFSPVHTGAFAQAWGFEASAVAEGLGVGGGGGGGGGGGEQEAEKFLSPTPKAPAYAQTEAAQFEKSPFSPVLRNHTKGLLQHRRRQQQQQQRGAEREGEEEREAANGASHTRTPTKLGLMTSADALQQQEEEKLRATLAAHADDNDDSDSHDSRVEGAQSDSDDSSAAVLRYVYMGE
jgi:hypothetical protein